MSNIYKIIIIGVIVIASGFAIARLAQNPKNQNAVTDEVITGDKSGTSSEPGNQNNNNPANNNTGNNAPADGQTGTILDLSNQNLQALPSSVLSQTNLAELNISHNALTGALPSQIGQLKNLKKLDASYNQMTGVPAELGQLENLEYLDLSYNKLTGLPNELANLRNLKTLNLTGNDYSAQDLQIIQEKLTNTNFIFK